MSWVKAGKKIEFNYFSILSDLILILESPAFILQDAGFKNCSQSDFKSLSLYIFIEKNIVLRALDSVIIFLQVHTFFLHAGIYLLAKKRKRNTLRAQVERYTWNLTRKLGYKLLGCRDVKKLKLVFEPSKGYSRSPWYFSVN